MCDARVSLPALVFLLSVPTAAVAPAAPKGASAPKRATPHIRIMPDETYESWTTVRSKGVTVRLRGRFPGFSVVGTKARPRVERAADGERTTYKGRVSLQFYQDGATSVEIDADGAVVERHRRRVPPAR